MKDMDMDDGVTMNCPCCGTAAPLGEWCESEVAGEYPRGHYQCPWCRYAFERRQQPGSFLSTGAFVPGAVSLHPAQVLM